MIKRYWENTHTRAARKIGALMAKRALQGRYTKGQLKRLSNLVAMVNRHHNASGMLPHLPALQAKRAIVRLEN